MTINQAMGVFSAAMEADDSVLMTSLHGIGKTESVRDWAKANDVHLEVLYLSTQETGDLVGIPDITVAENGEKITTWTVPSWLNNLNEAQKAGKRTCVFLDEFSRAPLDVRQASLQLVLDKKIHQHSLPVSKDGYRTLIIGGDNPDNGDYAVEAMDPALLDRWLSINVEVDVPSWLKWARENNVNKIVTDFIADNPSKLHWTPEQGSGDLVGATPRSFSKLGSFIDNIDNIAPELHYPIIAGKIGTALAAQFLQFMRTYTDKISMKDIESLVSEISTKTTNIERIGEGVKELTEKLEPIQKTELVHAFFGKYINKDSIEETVPMMAMLYSLDIEILTSFLKNYKNEDKEKYSRIVEIDKEMNNKGLFKRISSVLKFKS